MEDTISLKINNFVTKASIPKLDVFIWNDGKYLKSSYGASDVSHADVFEIGSIGKTFTATLLAILVKSGTVNLEDKVSKFKPDLPFAEDITLKNLVTHTSGLPGNPVKFSLIFNRKNIEKIIHFTRSDFDSYLKSLAKPLKTGKIRYSNVGMALLGNILAERLGCSYEDAVKECILKPLNMLDTHVSPSSYEKSRLNIGHDSNGKPVEPFLWEGMEAAGVWRSTANDMMRFLKAHLGYSGDYWENILASTICPAFEEANIGLAWFISQSRHEGVGRYVWHNGGTFGQKSMAIVAKEKNKAVIILSNKAPKVWQVFLPRYSLENLAEEILAVDI